MGFKDWSLLTCNYHRKRILKLEVDVPLFQLDEQKLFDFIVQNVTLFIPVFTPNCVHIS